MKDATTIYGLIGILIAAAFGLGGHWLANRAQKQANTTEDWSKLVERYDTQLESLQKDLAEMGDRVGRVERELAREQHRSWTAISYVRVLRRWISERFPDESPPEVPDVLKDDV